MAGSAVPQEIGQFINDRLATLRDRVEVWQAYYTGTVTLASVVYWLLQFGELQHVKLAYRLLEGVQFLSEEMIVGLLSTAVEQVPPETRESALLCPVGLPYDSASHISYPFSKNLGLSEESLAHMWTTTDGLVQACHGQAVSAIVFLDDNATSGVQFRKFLRELLTDTDEEREHVAQPLAPADADLVRRTPIYLAVAVDLAAKPDFERQVADEFGIRFRLLSGRRDYGSSMDFGVPLWKRPEDAREARDMVAAIARNLYADKGWSTAKLNERLLGYGNLGKLVVFQHNVPKSLLPIFWKYGEHAGHPWFPLFPEREEWRQYRERILSREPYAEFFATLVAGGQFAAAAPVCQAALVDPKPESGIGEVTVASTNLIDKFIRDRTAGLTPLKPMEPPPQAYDHFGLKLPTAFSSSPTTGEYERYNREVDAYNEAVNRYRRNIETAVREAAGAFAITARVSNRGTAAATNTILRVEIPPGLIYLPRMPDLPLRPDAPEKPRSEIDKLTRFNALLRSPQRALMGAMPDQMSRALSDDSPREIEDGERRYLEIPVGRVLQHTHRDVPVRYLRLTGEPGTYRLYYQLIYEQAARPIEGSFDLQVQRGDNLLQEAVDLFAGNED